MFASRCHHKRTIISSSGTQQRLAGNAISVSAVISVLHTVAAHLFHSDLSLFLENKYVLKARDPLPKENAPSLEKELGKVMRGIRSGCWLVAAENWVGIRRGVDPWV